MLLLSNEPIARQPRVAPDLAFQPGEVYVIKYMGQPTIVTVQARSGTKVTVWFDTLDAAEFNERVVFKLGKRVKLLGVWLPFAKCSPQTVLAHGQADALGCDFEFWTHRKRLPA